MYKVLSLVLLVLLSGGYNLALAVEMAANVEAMRGEAWAKSTGERFRSLTKNAPVYSGDRIKTAKNSSLKLLFKDKSKFEIGPETNMLIDEFSFEAPAKKSVFSTSIFSGVFRFVTGLIAKKGPKAMGVRLPVATIGIRGTNVVGEATATSAKVILVEPEGEARPTSIVVANNFGSVVIDEPGFGTEVPDEHSPPSPPRRMRLKTINNLMRSFQALQRIRVPRVRH